MDLNDFINAYRGPLIGLIASWGAPWSDATEIAQDSFAEAWLHRESFRGDWRQADNFGRWLRGVALNHYRNWARRRGRQRMRVVSLTPAVMEQAVSPTEADASSQLDALREAIERLPAKQRQVVLMHYLEETSVNKVSVLLGVAAKTVEGRLYQARQTLRRLLGEKCSDSSLGRTLLCL